MGASQILHRGVSGRAAFWLLGSEVNMSTCSLLSLYVASRKRDAGTYPKILPTVSNFGYRNFAVFQPHFQD